MPWYLGYIRAGQYLNCPPWELVDAWTPREFWRRAALIVANAEADAREYRDHLERVKCEAKARADEMKRNR